MVEGEGASESVDVYCRGGGGALCSRIHRSLTGDKVNSGIGLAYRPANHVDWRAGMTSLSRSWLDLTVISFHKAALQRQNTEISKQIFPENIVVSVPISTFMPLWVIYIFPQSVCLFCWRKYVARSWEYINRSQTPEFGNWGWGRAIPRKGIHKWDFRCSVPPPKMRSKNTP